LQKSLLIWGHSFLPSPPSSSNKPYSCSSIGESSIILSFSKKSKPSLAFDEEGGDGRNEWPQIRRDFCGGNTDIESLVSGVSNQRSARGIKSILRWADKIFKSNESKASEVDQEIITRLEQGRNMFEADVDTSLWDLAHGIFIEFKLSSMDEAEKITKDWYFSTTDTGYYNESTDKFEADIENDQVVQKLPDDKRSFDVEATEKGEWDWLDKGADSKSVDYDEVEYKDDGVSDISIQNAEPKGADANEFLDNVNIGLESVDFVYKTKASEAMEKTYIPVSETFEGDYEEFEDSDEAMIKETITLRKLTGYGDDAIARELHINYGVSHEEALEKVYSVEVSTNDRVSQTFFGKMYKECTESEKDELQMYSGSD